MPLFVPPRQVLGGPAARVTAAGRRSAAARAARAAALRASPGRLRRSARREATLWLARELQGCRTEAAVLVLVLAAGRHFGVRAVRFHRLSRDGRELVSIDGAGHTEMVARRLKDGAIRKHRDQCPLETADSFQCFNPVGPTIFQVVPGAETVLREIGWVGGVRFFEVSASQCDSSLGSDARPVHADIPLVFAGRPIGKLSCGLAAGVVTDRVVRRVERFQTVLRHVAAALAELHRLASQPLYKYTPRVRDGINTAADMLQLTDYAVGELPRHLRAAYANLYTFHTDDRKAERLVLRRTTDPANKGLVDGATAAGRRGYFRIGGSADESLAAWVAGRRRPFRWHRDAGHDLLRSIDPGLAPPGDAARWTLGRNYRCYLAVPLLVGDRLLGVLELTDKGTGNASEHYTHIDEGWLVKVANDHLAPRLSALLGRDVGVSERNPNKSSGTMALALATAIREAAAPNVNMRLVERELRMIALFARRNDESQVSCMLDRVNAERTEVVRIAQASATDWNLNDRPAGRVPYEGSLADQLERKKKGLFFFDASSAANLRNVLPRETKSVVACPVPRRPGDEGPQTIVTVVSDRYDLTPETHVPLLENVAGGAADFRNYSKF